MCAYVSLTDFAFLLHSAYIVQGSNLDDCVDLQMPQFLAVRDHLQKGMVKVVVAIVVIQIYRHYKHEQSNILLVY